MQVIYGGDAHEKHERKKDPNPQKKIATLRVGVYRFISHPDFGKQKRPFPS